jgi:hypothetical protein
VTRRDAGESKAIGQLALFQSCFILCAFARLRAGAYIVMAEAAFPIPAADLITTLAGLYRHRGELDMVELLESANPDVDLGYSVIDCAH